MTLIRFWQEWLDPFQKFHFWWRKIIEIPFENLGEKHLKLKSVTKSLNSDFSSFYFSLWFFYFYIRFILTKISSSSSKSKFQIWSWINPNWRTRFWSTILKKFNLKKKKKKQDIQALLLMQNVFWDPFFS